MKRGACDHRIHRIAGARLALCHLAAACCSIVICRTRRVVSIHPFPRRRFMSLMLGAPFLGSALMVDAETSAEALITDFGARPDGATINTKAIQAAIDHLASRRGGTVIVPQGTFVSGALVFKPKVNLRLRTGAVLQCSTD